MDDSECLHPRANRRIVPVAPRTRLPQPQLYVDDGSPDGITLDAAFHPTNAAGPAFLVLGTEGGFLPQAVSVPPNRPFDSVTFSGSLITAPAERWDLDCVANLYRTGRTYRAHRPTLDVGFFSFEALDLDVLLRGELFGAVAPRAQAPRRARDRPL
jgi:hypothetical protein